jgi:hypothetical protein
MMNNEDIDISEVMKRSLEYYKYIDTMGEKLKEIISNKIEPLLQQDKYREAKDMVMDFYKPSRYTKDDDDEGYGDVIFIEYDMILAHINRRMKSNPNVTTGSI